MCEVQGRQKLWRLNGCWSLLASLVGGDGVAGEREEAEESWSVAAWFGEWRSYSLGVYIGGCGTGREGEAAWRFGRWTSRLRPGTTQLVNPGVLIRVPNSRCARNEAVPFMRLAASALLMINSSPQKIMPRTSSDFLRDTVFFSLFQLLYTAIWNWVFSIDNSYVQPL